MKIIDNEVALFEHFTGMGTQKRTSEIEIPGVGKFRIFFQEVEDASKEVTINPDEIIIRDDEKFILWDDVLMKLQGVISRPSFETWFKNTSAILLDDQHVGVVCCNSFQVDWLQTNYKDTLINILEEVTGKRVGVEFFIGTAK